MGYVIKEAPPPYNLRLNNYTYYSGFKFHEESYPITKHGYVKLSKFGMKKLGTEHPYAKIVYCYEKDDGTKVYEYFFYNMRQAFYNKWSFESTACSTDDMLESVDAIDYKNMTIDDIFGNVHHDDFLYYLDLKSIADGTNNSDDKAKPYYKDWQLSSVMIGWVVVIAIMFLAGIFKDWYVSLPIRLFVGICFCRWRTLKLWGG